MSQGFPGRLKLVAGGVLLGLGALLLWYLQALSTNLSLVLVFLAFALILFPLLDLYLAPKKIKTARKDFIDIFLKFASSLLLILSLFVAWLSFDNTRQETAENLLLARTALENNLAEQRMRRFMDALEKISGDTPAKRLAGVYAFSQLDSNFRSEAQVQEERKSYKDSVESVKFDEKRDREKKEHMAIMEILTHFIQEVSPVPKDHAKARDPDALQQTEVREILKYLGSRKMVHMSGEAEGLNFFAADLSGYDFKNNGGSDVNNVSNFEGAQFIGAYLKRADFAGVKLQKAKFTDADLTGANFRGADLREVDFRNANLSGAKMKSALLSEGDPLGSAFADGRTECPDGFYYDGSTCVRTKP